MDSEEKKWLQVHSWGLSTAIVLIFQMRNWDSGRLGWWINKRQRCEPNLVSWLQSLHPSALCFTASRRGLRLIRHAAGEANSDCFRTVSSLPSEEFNLKLIYPLSFHKIQFKKGIPFIQKNTKQISEIKVILNFSEFKSLLLLLNHFSHVRLCATP